MCKRGDIILVPFPFTDLSSAKVRPALVLSAANERKPDIIVCFISSNLEGKNPHAVQVEPKASNGLKTTSVVRFDKIATLDKRIILGAIGSLSPEWLRKNQRGFLSVFGL
jgi:mRNA interferase MazF